MSITDDYNRLRVHQLTELIKLYPDIRVDIYGVILDYSSAVLATLDEVFDLNVLIYHKIFCSEDKNERDKARALIQSIAHSDELKKDLENNCSKKWPEIKVLLSEIQNMTRPHDSERTVGDNDSILHQEVASKSENKKFSYEDALSNKDEKGLIKVSGCFNNDRTVDVIFIHGIDGDALKTWSIDNNQETYWPSWLGKKHTNIGVWSLEYEASSSNWTGKAMPLIDLAVNILDDFDVNEIGIRKIIFICHSMGGLLVKQILNTSRDSHSLHHIYENTHSIFFISTPHSGSSMASWLDNLFGKVLRTSVNIKELKAHEPALRNLNTWYRDHSDNIQTFAYCEKKKTNGVKIVDESTADPGIKGVRPIPLQEDHISICKLKSERNQIYKRIIKVIKDNF